MIFRIKIAGKIISIHPLCAQTAVFFRSYIIKDNINDNADLIIRTTNSDVLTELNYMKSGINDKNIGIIPFWSEFELETLSILRKLSEAMPSYNTFLMHGSVIETNGFAYMITAPSGTGKSARTKLWLEEIPGSIVINGDKPLLRVENDHIFACGTPWCGKEKWNTNTEAPLRAIFLLERAEEGQSSYLTELTCAQALPVLLQQTYQPQKTDSLIKTMYLLKALDGKVKIYHFRSVLTREAVRLAYKTARP